MSTENALVMVIEKISDMIADFEEDVLKSEELSNLTIRQLFLLDTLYKLGSSTLSDFANRLNVTKPTVTAAINKLIKLKLVYKIQSKVDKRVYFINVTEDGVKKLNCYKKTNLSLAKQIMKCLDENELQQIIKIFGKISSHKLKN